MQEAPPIRGASAPAWYAAGTVAPYRPWEQQGSAGRQGQARGHRGAKLPAGLEVLPARVADHGHRRLRAPPLQATGDRLDRPHGSGGVAVAVDVEAVGSPDG